MNDDFYAILGVTPGVSAAEIERAYRRLARACHPDLLRHAAPEERRLAEERLKAINRAHHSLGDRERRAAYDRGRRRALAGIRPGASHSARAATARGGRTARAGVSRPGAVRTTHRAGGGPIDIEWTTAPPVAARPAADIFTAGRLLRYALAIIVFAALLGLLWHPNAVPPLAPTATAVVIVPVR